MRTSLRDALVARLSDYGRVVEVGVGRAPDVAAELAARGVDVVATDVDDVPVPEGVRFVRDDVVARADSSDLGPFAGADAVYALNLPVELQAPAARVARRVGADFRFTTLGYDEAAIPVRRESLPGGDVLFAAADSPGGRR